MIVYNLSDFVSSRAEGRIVAPETNTYTFTCSHDDGCNVTVGTTQVLTRWANGVFTTTGTISLVQGQEYALELEWYEWSAGGYNILYWEYGSNAQELVPFVASWQSYERIIASSPYTVTVLEPLCGNVNLDSGEQCDDGNTVSGDG